jgi:PAS domain S-box-containing protein
MIGLRDLSMQSQTVSALQDSEERLELALQAARMGVWEWDLRTDAVYWSPLCYEVFGLKHRGEVTLQTFLDLVHPDDTARVTAAAEQAIKDRTTYSLEFRIVGADGEEYWVSNFGRPSYDEDGQPCRLTGTAVDITEHKHAEATLRASEAKYRSLFELARDVIYSLGPDGTFTSLNPAFETITGWSVAEWLDTPFLPLVHPDDVPRAMSMFRQALDGQTPPIYDLRIRCKSGSFVVGEFASIPIVKAGRMTQVLGVARNITPRRQAEEALSEANRQLSASRLAALDMMADAVDARQELEKVNQHLLTQIAERQQIEVALRESEAKARSFVDNAVWGLCRTTVGGQFLSVNPALVAMLGYESAAELLATPMQAVYRDPDVRHPLRDQLLSAGRLDGVEVEWKRKDGAPITVRLCGAGVYGSDHRIVEFETSVEDVTIKRALEAQLRQSQKMEAIGRLAGGIAHDFNNMLTAILGYTQLVIEQVPADDPRRQDLLEVRKAGESAAMLVAQLLAFSRKQVLAPALVDLNVVLADLDGMLRRVIGEDIELEMRLGDLGRVTADPSQIEQVILNLAINARDAMPSGGRLKISTSAVVIDEHAGATHAGTAPGVYTLLEVNDTGCGMSQETQSHIFEPFFTTKESGKGTGLGLPTVYGIVNQGAGHISVTSEPGRGATFRVYLPVAEGIMGGASSDERPADITGTETVLLVEDDDRLRQLAERTLRRSGYLVLSAASAEEAVSTASQHQGTIDLLLTDVVLPGLSGGSLAEQVRETRPSTKILFVSGFTDDVIVLHGVSDASAGFLQKPYTPTSLGTKVREVLNSVTG